MQFLKIAFLAMISVVSVAARPAPQECSGEQSGICNVVCSQMGINTGGTCDSNGQCRCSA
ncbi:hypothetical protein MBM_01588 [Drepanopeziza brunnea f. sp. 'multigermtubi' MB_m1]|uniref:Invertebrate defensins family profile domain-containing protein n=1 Tax=Marssonina brunnea f. sp. multigermtubi (strain MB_m1) TaxID=1072389 RepID=K1X368_MARBU|nr:uncharacterized protein MBM_01588 [Drepanopeziza brunnea f. sp. 'multigermtubi' MB_m1]EKD19636.1 hypothetical protein MBM_01588 [Drepanopeziza brunnea f. sp. 'multigermtubi' MB_m1]